MPEGLSLREANAERIALARLLDATDPYVELAAPHEELFSGRDLRNFEALVAARQVAQIALGGDDA